MRGKLAVLMLAMALLTASFALGAVQQEASTTEGTTGKYDGTTTAGTATAEGGNVTEVDVTSDATTDAWQGFYGNTTANLALGLGTNVMYDFGEQDAYAVYATTSNSFDFSSIQSAGATDVNSAWTNLGGVEGADNVYNETLTAPEDDLSFSTNSTVMQDGNFQTYVTNDGAGTSKGNFAFGGVVNPTGASGFDGTNYNYELMVPEESGEQYYFFMSI